MAVAQQWHAQGVPSGAPECARAICCSHGGLLLLLLLLFGGATAEGRLSPLKPHFSVANSLGAAHLSMHCQ